jgi:hypothetical protein
MRKLAFICLVSFWIAPALYAAVIVQDNSQFLAFEAETAFTSNDAPSPWVVIDDLANNHHPHVAASMDQAIVASGTSIPRGTATYQLQFMTAGNYYLHLRDRSDGAKSGGITPAPSVTFLWPGSVVENLISINSLTWVGNWEYTWMDSTVTFAVTAEELNHPLSAVLEIRKTDIVVDRLVFDTTAQADAASMDKLANAPVHMPEPTAAALASLLAAVLLGRRPAGGRNVSP